MKIDVSRHGLLLHPSKPPIPRTLVQVGGQTGSLLPTK